MTTMHAEEDLPFDPRSPGARRLLRAAHDAADQVEVVMTKGFFLEHDDHGRAVPRLVGDEVTLQRRLADVLIRQGAARRSSR